MKFVNTRKKYNATVSSIASVKKKMETQENGRNKRGTSRSLEIENWSGRLRGFLARCFDALRLRDQVTELTDRKVKVGGCSRSESSTTETQIVREVERDRKRATDDERFKLDTQQVADSF